MSGVSLQDIIMAIPFKDMVYLKGKRGKFQKGIYSLDELSKLKLKKYKDYYRLPRITFTDLYNGFLNSVHLKEVKYELHQERDFELAFRIFIDDNEKYGHSLYDPFFDYKYKITKKMALEWCKKYRIKYIDDTDQYWKPKD